MITYVTPKHQASLRSREPLFSQSRGSRSMHQILQTFLVKFLKDSSNFVKLVQDSISTIIQNCPYNRTRDKYHVTTP